MRRAWRGACPQLSSVRHTRPPSVSQDDRPVIDPGGLLLVCIQPQVALPAVDHQLHPLLLRGFVPVHPGVAGAQALLAGGRGGGLGLGEPLGRAGQGRVGGEGRGGQGGEQAIKGRRAERRRGT